MSDKSKEHGPHGPNCECNEDDEVVAAGVALATCLAEILPAMLARWAEGDNGVTVDFRFDRGKEIDGIAVRVRPLEETGHDWPEPNADNVHVLDPTKELEEMAEAFESRTIVDPRPSNGKDYVH